MDGDGIYDVIKSIPSLKHSLSLIIINYNNQYFTFLSGPFMAVFLFLVYSLGSIDISVNKFYL